MKLPSRIHRLARWGRAVLMPIGEVDEHLRSLVLKTGKELRFDRGTYKNLEMETETTLHEMGIYRK